MRDPGVRHATEEAEEGFIELLIDTAVKALLSPLLSLRLLICSCAGSRGRLLRITATDQRQYFSSGRYGCSRYAIPLLHFPKVHRLYQFYHIN